VDAGPAIVEKGDWVALSPGAWQSMAGLGLNYNWNIHAYVDGGDRLLPRFTAGSREREINGYTVWRSTESGMNYQNIGFCEVDRYPIFS